ncbi:helix-turn-helix domain-containing protein [Aequorivita marisscotiae]|uniref:Helix-turn-helix domain-containing protein n=1 Tax=Aequorivita marisscotiae TaxID=3040348 RepID=A0ABY8KT49_9FLAO|nr:helix-turn-helix domain-containing protein [Aequorivita sp. Ant34-E75]WGF91250.1 helix-turn-helix domain-containing protein [Aequorivita sp. Ant34-E75]
MLFFTLNAIGQNDGDYAEMLLNAETILYTQPDESIKIANHVLQNSENSNQLLKAYLLNTTAYYLKGAFEDAVKAGVEAKILAEASTNVSMQLQATMASIPILNHLGLDIVAQQYYKNTKVLATTLTQVDSLYLKGGNALVQAYQASEKDKWQEAFTYFEQANSFFKNIPDPVLVNETIVSIAEIYPKLYSVDTAQAHLNTILETTGGQQPNNYLKMVVLNKMGELFFLRQEYAKAIESYQTALQIAKLFENITYQSQISENLSSVYLALKNTSQFYSYKKNVQQLDDEVETAEEQAVNAIYNYVNKNNTAKRDILKLKFTKNMLISSAFLALIILIWLLLRFRYRRRAKQYNRFLTFFENRKNPVEIVPIKEVSKGLNIPQETENALVNKLAQFEKSKQFTKQDMSLALLAANLDTNTKYLSEVINSHKGKNFNSYINELRINYIIDKLKSNRTYLQYKISYLAEESGFSSHSSFATVFKAVTGISPTVFIDLLKSSKKSSKPVYEEVE